MSVAGGVEPVPFGLLFEEFVAVVEDGFPGDAPSESEPPLATIAATTATTTTRARVMATTMPERLSRDRSWITTSIDGRSMGPVRMPKRMI